MRAQPHRPAWRLALILGAAAILHGPQALAQDPSAAPPPAGSAPAPSPPAAAPSAEPRATQPAAQAPTAPATATPDQPPAAAAEAPPSAAPAAPQPSAPQPPAAQAPAAPPPAAPAPATPAPAAQTPAAREELPREAAQRVIGREVTGPSGDVVGRIVNVLMDENTQPRAAVLDYGGFLGVGRRRVAVAWRTLRFSPESVRLELTRDQIRAFPDYKEGEPVVVAAPPPAPDSTPGASAPAAEPANKD